jgi:thiamine kinase-like enzyme
VAGAAHGDFAPWNLLETDEGWALVDWENCRATDQPYFDLFHYLVQSNSELRRPTKRAILEGLRLNGWVGGVIEAYARGCGIDARDASLFLRDYLRTSAKELELSAPSRGARVRRRLSDKVGPTHR